MKPSLRLVALAVVLAASCVRPAGIAPALAACPAPRQQTDGWRAVSESAGVTFRIPPDFVERPSDEGAHRFHLRGDFSEYLLAGFIASSSPAETMGRAPGPGMMEMTQCVDSIGGRQALVQAWRTRGGTFRDGQRMDRYDVFAVVPVSPVLRFYIASGSHRRETQQLALAAVRTIVVAPAPPLQQRQHLIPPADLASGARFHYERRTNIFAACAGEYTMTSAGAFHHDETRHRSSGAPRGRLHRCERRPGT